MQNPSDTGAALRAQHAGGTGAIFGPKVRDYAASRPDYPAALFEALAGWLPARDARIADIGAGTGLLTAGLLARGWRVDAIEPNEEMRAACDAWLGGRAGYRSQAGRAEALPLAEGSLDLLTAAQAFHWFEIEAARAEALRVLKPDGAVALIWNDRVIEAPLHRALDELFAEFGGAKRAALLAHEERHEVPRFFGAARVEERAWPHEHRLDAAGLEALVFSRSYMPAREGAAGRAVSAALATLFAEFAAGAPTLGVPYRTVAMIGRPAA
ncbi:class I SAM-dependent methyltransferase [Roseateles sp. DAIF2]|uniref:class I SAM-dependent methyltransferase n=1 Tax=Roseateles sp. DAIF2 TaxID=2714952 RepID=UPI0018A27F37|nr:class I SAM-dependent methyltransferase [Roseateles sp. DAIF2]QPF75773.1 class I SAM-dependent methyltransferase [Roseateles sp. DAIF2]